MNIKIGKYAEEVWLELTIYFMYGINLTYKFFTYEFCWAVEFEFFTPHRFIYIDLCDVGNSKRESP